MHSVLHTTKQHPHTLSLLTHALAHHSLYLSTIYHTTTLHGTHHNSREDSRQQHQLNNTITAPVDSTNRQSFYLCFPTTLTPLPTIASTSSLQLTTSSYSYTTTLHYYFSTLHTPQSVTSLG